MSGLDELLALIESTDGNSLKYEIKVLRAIKAWAIKQACDFTVGDRVEMTGSLHLDSLGGWAPYAETMAPGATAVVQRIDFNEYHDYWYADIIFDREWSVGGGLRHWNGPVAETPEGFEPPTRWNQEAYPEGRKHTFAMPVRHLRRVVAEVIDE